MRLFTRTAVTVAAAATAATLALGGCGLPEPPEDGSGTPSPSTTATPIAPTTPTPAPPAPTRPTVAALTVHLDGVINSTYETGRLTCEGSGPIGEGSAVVCDWQAAPVGPDDPTRIGPQRGSGPVYVALLDDGGRYTFSSRGMGSFDAAAGGGYLEGTISCATLRAAPDASSAGNSAAYGLDYATLLHYWMSLGSPDSMDDDRNGLPCETVYPADVVQRVAASPLTLALPTTSATRDEVRAHVEAVNRGVYVPAFVEPIGSVETRDDKDNFCGGEDAVAAGDTMVCRDHNTEWGMRQSAGLYVSVLDDTGRYTFGFGLCCGEGPNPGDYASGATCSQLSSPPPGGHWSMGLTYRSALYTWMSDGRNPAMDADGDGFPCEDHYPPSDVDKVRNSTLQP